MKTKEPLVPPVCYVFVQGLAECPALTTARQPCNELAVTAFYAMLERQTEPNLPPRHMTIMPQLVVRDSSGTGGEATSGSAPNGT
jgi:hypothetical protein